MNDFVYDIPVKVYFGQNQLAHLGAELAVYGQRVLLVYGGGSIKKTGLYAAVVREIEQAGLQLFEISGIEPNPRIRSVREGAELCKKEKIDVLLAVGGGSTIDAAKFMAAGACVDFDPWLFFSEWAAIEKALPLITMPTLAATGSEMDCGGVISNPETQDKIGRMAGPLLPKVSFLNPMLTYTVSRYQTACGSADIFNHIMEVYFNLNQDLYLLDSCMEAMMRTVIKYAPIALRQPDDYEARANLMWTSSWAINGFADGGKRQAWSCHPIEHELSAVYDITHGHGLAILAPRWMQYCLNEKTAEKYRQFGVNVFGISQQLPVREIAQKSIEALEKFFFETLGLASTLQELDIDDKYFARMAEKSCPGGVLPGFVSLQPEDVEKILRMCL